MSDTEEFEHGTDPNQGIDPLTEENAFKPWERLGISEDEWNDLEKSILEEINPAAGRASSSATRPRASSSTRTASSC